MKLLRRFTFATILAVLFTATSLWADDDPPGRVARIQYTSGSVSVQPQGTEDWVEAALNRPLTDSDNVWTDKGARAELNVGTGVLRMDSESSLTLTNISDNTVQVQLHQGTLSLRIRKLYGGEIYEVDTPNAAFTVQKSGEYRFDVDPNGDVSEITVWKGEGDATGEGPAVRVREHQTVRFTNGTSMSNQVASARVLDGFDDWGRVRDRREGSVSARYVSPDVIGYEDLDEYGSWREVPTYGPIWVPRSVEVGWAPYRYGHWVWISPWGWTWVDDAAWGFAPFHYGRWVYTGGYWGWAPGPYRARHIYAPALVAWFGGSNWGASFGFSGGYGYGWCPLGFGEPFIPWYRGSRGYFRNVNITNTRITNITVIENRYYNARGFHNDIRYANLRSPGGVTAVSRETIVGSRPVYRSAVNVSASQFERARLGGRMDLAPDRQSRLGVNAGRNAAIPPQRSFSRPVVSKMAPPPARTRSEFANVGRGNAVEAGPNHAQTPGRFGQPENGRETSMRNVPRPPARTETATRAAEATPSRSVPRPGNQTRGADGQRPEMRSGVRSERSEAGSNQNNPRVTENVPRPQANPGRTVEHSTPQVARPSNDSRFGGSSGRTSAPASAPSNDRGSSGRPAAERPAPHPSNNGGSNRSNNSPRSSSRPSEGGRSMNEVPRPTGTVMPASSSSYRSSGNSNSQMQRSYAGNSREVYGSASQPSISQRSMRSAPSYSAPSRSFSSEGMARAGNRSYSAAPSYRSSGSSYRGTPSGGASARSFGGGSRMGAGGSGRSFGGGGGRPGHPR